MELPATYGICVPVMMDLLDCLGRRHLFPNLRVLTIRNEADSFFFCPNLERLDVRVQRQRELYCLLPRLAQTTPSLRHLNLFDHTIPDAMMHLTSHFNRLQSLETKNDFIVSSESSESFSSLFPFAEHLKEWRVGSLTFCPSNVVTPEPIQFSSLTSLNSVNPVTPEKTITLLSHGLFPKLQKFTFPTPLYSGNPAAYKKSLLELCSNLFTKMPAGLQFFYLRGDGKLLASREATQMDLEDLLPMTKNKTLTTLWMSEQKLLLRPTLASVDRLGTAFPFLTDLYLYLHRTALVSFDVVAALAITLPLLRCLDIGIKGENLADPPTVPLLSHPLKELSLRNSEIGNAPFLFARYIDRLFPFATIDEDELPDDAVTVVSALKLVRDCRKDEEQRSMPTPLRRSKRLENSEK